MNVGELKKVLESIPDDTPVLIGWDYLACLGEIELDEMILVSEKDKNWPKGLYITGCQKDDLEFLMGDANPPIKYGRFVSELLK